MNRDLPRVNDGWTRMAGADARGFYFHARLRAVHARLHLFHARVWRFDARVKTFNAQLDKKLLEKVGLYNKKAECRFFQASILLFSKA